MYKGISMDRDFTLKSYCRQDCVWLIAYAKTIGVACVASVGEHYGR